MISTDMQIERNTNFQVTFPYFRLRCGTWPNLISTSISRSSFRSPVPALLRPSLWTRQYQLGNVFALSEEMASLWTF